MDNLSLKADWSQLPNDIYHIILKFYYESQGDYWSQITEQWKIYIPHLLTTQEQRRNALYHLNKRKLLRSIKNRNGFTNIREVKNPSVKLIVSVLNYYHCPIKIKEINNNKKSLKNKKQQRCSVCGKLGHNKNNRNFH